MAFLPDHEVEDQQPLAQIQEPEFQNEPDVAIFPNPSLLEINQPINVEGDSALEAPHKESDPTSVGLPHQKRSTIQLSPEVTTAQ